MVVKHDSDPAIALAFAEIEIHKLVQGLGVIAADLRKEAKKAEQQRDQASRWLSRHEVPDGHVIVLISQARKDMEAERFDEDSGELVASTPDSLSYSTNINASSEHRWPADESSWAFQGTVIEYDPEYNLSWVYNNTRDYRVLFEHGMTMFLHLTDQASN